LSDGANGQRVTMILQLSRLSSGTSGFKKRNVKPVAAEATNDAGWRRGSRDIHIAVVNTTVGPSVARLPDSRFSQRLLLGPPIRRILQLKVNNRGERHA
jgi:hypothetical protein